VETGQRLTKGLAITGSVMLWAAFAILVSALGSHPRNVNWFGLLAFAAMELSPLVLIGACVAMFAAVRARSRRLPIGCGLAAVSGSIAAGMRWGPSNPAVSWPLPLLATLIAAYWLGALAVGVASVSLARALGTRRTEGPTSASPG
jgi:hypothetical protein